MLFVGRSFVAVAAALLMLGVNVVSTPSVASANDAADGITQRTLVHRVAEGTDGRNAVHSWVASVVTDRNAMAVRTDRDTSAANPVVETAALEARTSAQLAVILFTLPSAPSLATTVTTVRDTYFGTGRSATQFYGEASNGTFALSGDAFGPYAVDGVDDSACWVDDWAAAARSKAVAAGVDFSGYTNFAYIFPRMASCPWAGMAELGGTASFINGMASGEVGLYHAVHELGHNFGSGHAHSYRCLDGNTAVAMAAASACSSEEYGDPFTVMGSGFIRLPNGWERTQMGLLAPGAVQVVDVDGTQRLRVSALERDSGTRLIRVRRADGTLLDLEYRQPFGRFDDYGTTDPAVRGVVVQFVPDDSAAETSLIDTTPGTATFDDATLTAGRTFSDPDAGVSVTVVAIDGEGATLDITVVHKASGDEASSDVMPPLAPGGLVASLRADSAVQLSWQPALDNVGVATYRVARDGDLLTDGGDTTYLDQTALQHPATYRVQAVDAAGNVGPEAVLEVQPPDRTAPTAPGRLSSRRVDARSIRVKWGPATDDRGGVVYEIRLDGRQPIRTTSVSRVFSGLARGSHRIVVRAVDLAGNAGPSVRLNVRV